MLDEVSLIEIGNAMVIAAEQGWNHSRGVEARGAQHVWWKTDHARDR